MDTVNFYSAMGDGVLNNEGVVPDSTQQEKNI